MQYFSTNRKSAHVSFREATRNGQPQDKGLYFPAEIPILSAGFWKGFPEKSQAQIAFEVIKPFIGNEIDEEMLFHICEETVKFEFPLVKITDRISTLELFHGATYAFKDVGARFMSRCLRYFSREKSEKTIVIVATSGDTGGAVANGFYGVEDTEVVILYPKGKVSRIQELQLTTLGKISRRWKLKELLMIVRRWQNRLGRSWNQRKRFLTSANSINVARWLPQQFYYFYAYRQWQNALEETKDELPVICVPSGNFGNICAGILAHITGLPMKNSSRQRMPMMLS